MNVLRVPSHNVRVAPEVAVWTASPSPARIVIALPGRGGTARQLAGDLGPYFAAGTFDVALACVDGGESYWHPRAGGQDRLAMLIDEVIPALRARWPSARGKLGILGMSMGGYGAIVAAEFHPQLFDRLCVMGPALWQSQAEQASAVPDAFDGPADFAAFDPFVHRNALRGVRVRIVCGTGDPFFTNALAFAQDLKRDGIAVETEFIEGGCHGNETWLRGALADLGFVSGLEKGNGPVPG
jgi:S-formylglutathione hydrolase FrmB